MKTIYGLHNGNSIIRYIGQTTDVNRRLAQHKNMLGGPLLSFWLSIHGGKVQLTQVEKCKSEFADAAEIFWIDYYRREGFPLVNIRPGGSENNRGPTFEHLKTVRDNWNRCSVHKPHPLEVQYLKALLKTRKRSKIKTLKQFRASKIVNRTN